MEEETKTKTHLHPSSKPDPRRRHPLRVTNILTVNQD